MDGGTLRFGPKGLTVGDYLKLLRMLCADFPDDVARAFLEVLAGPARADDAAVEFFEFLGGVKACLAFEELLGEVEQVFEDHGVSVEEDRGARASRGSEAEGSGEGGTGAHDDDVIGLYSNAIRNLSLEGGGSAAVPNVGTGAGESGAPVGRPKVVSSAVLRGVLGKMAHQTGRRGDERWSEFKNVAGAVLDELGERITFNDFALAVFHTMAPAVYHHHRAPPPASSARERR